MDLFCFLAECQLSFIAEGRTQLCVLSVSSEMPYFKWFCVSKLGKLIFLNLAFSKFMDLIFMLFLPERLKLRNSVSGHCNYYSLLATTAIKFTIP